MAKPPIRIDRHNLTDQPEDKRVPVVLETPPDSTEASAEEKARSVTGEELVAYWDKAGVGDAWSKRRIKNSSTYARRLRHQAERRELR